MASSPQQPNYNPFPPGQSSRSFVLECDAEALEGMRKRADFKGFEDAPGFSIDCDEPALIGGDNSAPPPLPYFAASILF